MWEKICSRRRYDFEKKHSQTLSSKMLGVVSILNINTIQTQEDLENEYHIIQKAKWKEYNDRPEVKARKKIHNESLQVKKYKREYWKRPEVKERKNELNKEPNNKERNRDYDLLKNTLKRIIKQSYLEPIQDLVNQQETEETIQLDRTIRIGMEGLY